MNCWECLNCPIDPVFCVGHVSNCPLSDADIEIINAMIAGEWRCETCGKSNGCTVKWTGPCKRWRKREGE